MKPISHLKRTLIFWGMTIVFLLLIPWILMISFGYKLDDALSFVKTGGIYVHSEMSNTVVYINGKYVKDNGVFVRNVLIQKLKPNQYYKIEIRKDNYQSWIKTIYVYPSLVSEGHVLMMPNEFTKREIFPFFDKEGNGVSSPVTGFTKIKKTTDGRIIPENQEYIDIITLFEGKNPFAIKVPEIVKSIGIATSTIEKIIPSYYKTFGIKDPKKLKNLIETSDEISWLKDGNIVLYWKDKIENIPYYYCGGEKERLCNEEIILDWKDEIKKFEYLPRRNDVWIVLISNGIYAVEVDPRSERNIQKIYLGEELDFEISSNGNLIVKDKGSFIELVL